MVKTLSLCGSYLTKYELFFFTKNNPFVLVALVHHVPLCVSSQYEMELFENEAACQTPLERQYHLDVKALKKARGRRNRRIFTYTDHDRYTNSLPFNQLVRSPIHLYASVSHAESGLQFLSLSPHKAILIDIAEHKQSLAHIPG